MNYERLLWRYCNFKTPVRYCHCVRTLAAPGVLVEDVKAVDRGPNASPRSSGVLTTLVASVVVLLSLWILSVSDHPYCPPCRPSSSLSCLTQLLSSGVTAVPANGRQHNHGGNDDDGLVTAAMILATQLPRSNRQHMFWDTIGFSSKRHAHGFRYHAPRDTRRSHFLL